VTAQLSLKVSEALKPSSKLLKSMMKNWQMKQPELLETDSVLQLKATNRDGKRSG